MERRDPQAHDGDTLNHEITPTLCASTITVDTWVDPRYINRHTSSPPTATGESDMARPTHVEGVAIRRLPDAPETPAKWRRTRVTNLPIAAALDSLRADRDQFGSDASTDTRGYAPTFPESEQDLEATGTTQVTTDLDGTYQSYLDR